MKTTHDAATLVSRFPGKTSLGVILLTGLGLLTVGCSDAAPPIPHASCDLTTRSIAASPSVQVAVKANAGASPDVTLRGAGFPAGASVSIGLFGLPPVTLDGTTVDLDLPNRVVVQNDGTFDVTQFSVSDVRPCNADVMDGTISIAVGANGRLSGTTAPASFWCENGRTESYGETCP